MRDRIKCLKCEKFFYRNNKSVVCPTCIQKDSKEYYTKKIADLEAKLAESEEKCKKAYQEGLLQKQFDKDAEIMQLKQQLETLEKERELDNSFWKQECDRLQKTLAEKEQEIKKLKFIVNMVDKYKQYDKHPKELILLNKDNCYINGHKLIIETTNQDKIDYAVEQLEKVKDIIYRFDVSYDEINNLTIALDNYTNGFHKAKFKATILIDNQIKQLKEGK